MRRRGYGRRRVVVVRRRGYGTRRRRSGGVRALRIGYRM